MFFDEETVDLLKTVVRKNGYLDLPAQGTSMFPFIREGNLCRFEVCEPFQLKKGEVALYHADTGQLTAHRFFGSKIVNDEVYLVFKGDTNLGFDQPVRKDQVIGKLLYVHKRKSLLHVSDFRSLLWRKLIFLLPMLSGILRTYLNHKNRISF